MPFLVRSILRMQLMNGSDRTGFAGPTTGEVNQHLRIRALMASSGQPSSAVGAHWQLTTESRRLLARRLDRDAPLPRGCHTQSRYILSCTCFKPLVASPLPLLLGSSDAKISPSRSVSSGELEAHFLMASTGSVSLVQDAIIIFNEKEL